MHPWIAHRTTSFDSSGIRRVFDLAAKLTNPINLSIGQPDFDVPEPIKEAAIDAIRAGRNAYSPTQGIAPLRQAFLDRVRADYPGQDRDVFISSGTSGGLTLAMLSLINPGDEVIFLDPYFVMYPSLVRMCGGVPVTIDSYPDFRLDPEKIAAAITPRTKMILVNSPANPTGVTAAQADLKAVAELAARHNVALLSDEIYSRFIFDDEYYSPASDNPDTIVIDGFSKSHAMTGWRVGFVHGPSEVIRTMMKLQQFSFVCAPQPFQWAALRALDENMQTYVDQYRQKRDYLVQELSSHYDLTTPGGAFYLFPKTPEGQTGTRFVESAIEHSLLVIPGHIFSQRDTHFRISFAADDLTLQRGVEVLKSLAKT